MIERGAGRRASPALFLALRSQLVECAKGLGDVLNFDPTLHTLFNIQELVEGDVTELTSRGAEVQVTLLWVALLGTKLQKPT